MSYERRDGPVTDRLSAKPDDFPTVAESVTRDRKYRTVSALSLSNQFELEAHLGVTSLRQWERGATARQAAPIKARFRELPLPLDRALRSNHHGEQVGQRYGRAQSHPAAEATPETIAERDPHPIDPRRAGLRRVAIQRSQPMPTGRTRRRP